LSASWCKRRLCEEAGSINATFVADKSQLDGKNARMNSPTTGLRVASLIFALFALGHIARLIKHAPVVIGSHHIPLWASVVALIVAAALSIWMWRLSNLKGIA